MDCQNPIGFKRLVFAVAQDCKKWQKMLSNSKRLFTHCLRRHEKSTCEKLVSACIVDQTGLEPVTSRL